FCPTLCERERERERKKEKILFISASRRPDGNTFFFSIHIVNSSETGHMSWELMCHSTNLKKKMMNDNYVTIRNRCRIRRVRLAIHQLLKDDVNKLRCNITGLNDFVESRQRWNKRHTFWLVLFLVCTFMLTYQIYDRIMFYLSYPTAVDVTSDSEEVVLPILAICSANSKKMVKLWNRTYVRLTTDELDPLSTESFKCLNMLNSLMANQTYNINELCEATNISEEIVSIDIKVCGERHCWPLLAGRCF
uniref:Uncharacterized protein n=1 Tax=Strigamia maritima TaxID=126957 RepID=T1JA36_STRMM